MTRRESSLFTRLVALISLVLALGAGALVAAAWYYARTASNEAYDRLLIGAALQIASALAVEDGVLVPDIPVAAFEMLALSERDRIFYRVIGTRGETLTGYEDLDAGGDLVRAQEGPVVAAGRYRGEPVRIVIVARAMSDPAVSGWVHTIVAQTELSRSALARELTLRALILVTIMSVLALSGVVFAIRHALLPLKRVEAALRARDPNDLTALNVGTPREILPFVDGINHFMDRLRERMDLLQRFIADAAHQIRTPLTALSSQVELMSDADVGPREREHLARIKSRATQLAHLTNQILSHAMVIHRTDAIAFSAVDLVEVARRALRDAVPISLDRDVVVALEAPDKRLTILGERVSLREAISNVIDNAVRHGAPSRLTVRVLQEREAAVVEVEDDGPGIPEADWPVVMARFGARQEADGRRPAGLGFAIAAEVCAAHGGGLGFRSPTASSGFVVRLTFPIRGDQP